jgi:hypothetical protein
MSGLFRQVVTGGRRRLSARTPIAAVTAAVLTTTGAAALALNRPPPATRECRVSYAISASWPGGFTASVTITNLGSPIADWTLAFTLPGHEAVSQRWNATYHQSGQHVTATNTPYNAGLRTNEATTIGFNSSSAMGAVPGKPPSFTLNATPCTNVAPPRPTPLLPPPTKNGFGSSGHLFESSQRFAQFPVGGYAVSNDEWGTGYNTQTVWADSATDWGLSATQPDTPGVKSYANISKNVDVPLNSLSSATSSFNESNPAGGNWESAYDLWLNGTGIEVMAWTYVNGNARPLGYPERTITLGDDTWTLYVGDNGHNPTYSFVRYGNETSGTVDILGLLKYLENTGHYFSNPVLSSIQYGWEISGTGDVRKNFTMNDYSASTS